MERLCLIPALLTIVYAVINQWRRRNTLNVFLIIVGGGIVIFNAYVMYGFFTKAGMLQITRSVQQVLSCFILPIAYMYFAPQMGRKWLNPVTVTLWLLLLILAVPTGLHSLDLVVPRAEETRLEPMTMYFFLKGKEVYQMHMADLVILIQAILTLTRMFALAQIFRRYHIVPSPHVRYFLLCWAAAIVFIIFTSLHTTDEFSKSSMLWMYYGGYSSLAIGIFLLISLNLDLRPIMLAVRSIEEDNEGGDTGDTDDDEADVRSSDAGERKEAASESDNEVLDDIDSFLMQSHVMAERVRMILADERRCLDVNLTTESAIQELGTNRTYFYRMVKAEFGCTFNELLLRHRMKHAVAMLTGTDLSIQEISVRCGFADNNTFSRRFRQLYGMTPSRYRTGNAL